MKRFLLRILLVSFLVAAFMPFAIPLAAHAQTISSHPPSHRGNTVHPYTTGGGCSGVTYSGNNTRFVEYYVCVSAQEDWPRGDFINPDGYVTFGAANLSFWTMCTVYMYLVDYQKGIVDGGTQSCLAQARAGDTWARFALDSYLTPGYGHTLYNEMEVCYKYNGDSSEFCGNYVFSPNIRN